MFPLLISKNAITAIIDPQLIVIDTSDSYSGFFFGFEMWELKGIILFIEYVLSVQFGSNVAVKVTWIQVSEVVLVAQPAKSFEYDSILQLKRGQVVKIWISFINE